MVSDKDSKVLTSESDVLAFTKPLRERGYRSLLIFLLLLLFAVAFVVFAPFWLVASGSFDFELRLAVVDQDGYPIVAQVRVMDDKGKAATHFPVQEFTQDGDWKTDAQGKLTLHSQMYGYSYLSSLAGLKFGSESDYTLVVEALGYQQKSFTLSDLSHGRVKGQVPNEKSRWTVKGPRPGWPNPSADMQSDSWSLTVELAK